MSKTNILVVINANTVAKDIQNSLIKLGYTVPPISNNANAAIDEMEETMTDLVIIDMMLKGDTGSLEVANIIKKKFNIPIIFLSDNSDEKILSKSKLIEPYSYIFIPYRDTELYATIELVLHKHQKDTELRRERDIFASIILNKESSNCVFVKLNSKHLRVPNKDIQYVEALKDYVIIHTKTAKYTIHSTMKDIYKKLQASEFVRIHRSYIVSVEKITAVDYPSLYLEEIKKPLPIGASFKDDLFERLNFV